MPEELVITARQSNLEKRHVTFAGNLAFDGRELWRRQESNTGPVSVAEDAGAIGSRDSGEKTEVCGDAGRVATASENAGESGTCSNVASRLTLTELLELIEAEIRALDTGEIEVARARLLALAATMKPYVTPRTNLTFEPT